MFKIQTFLFNFLPYSRTKTLPIVIGVGSNTVAYLCTADIEQRRIGNCNILRYILKGIAGTRIYDDTIGREMLEDKSAVAEPYDVYDLSGRKVRNQVTSLEGLPNGLDIVNGKKLLKK